MNVFVEINKHSAIIKLENLPDIIFESDGIISNNISDFALWAITPITMRLGGDFKCNFKVSKKTFESVKRVIRIWSNWVPEKFQVPNFSNIKPVSITSCANKNCCFFSGGVDSTYSAIKLGSNGIKSDSITIHGMDYKFNDFEKFNLLLKQTENFRVKYFLKSYNVRTNIYDIYDFLECDPFDSHITHIFSLFASGSLFNSYMKYFIAADLRIDQQYAVHPYGSNSATNAYMQNAHGQLITQDDDVGRSAKIKYLIDKNIDLSSISICKKYNIRPKNCGVCGKCMRTKVLFYTVAGYVPDIFIDSTIPNDWYINIDVNDKIQRVFMSDVLDAVSCSNFVSRLNYEDAYNYWRKAAIDSRLKQIF